MRVTVEPPEGWAAARQMEHLLTGLGYQFTEWVVLGMRVFEITG